MPTIEEYEALLLHYRNVIKQKNEVIDALQFTIKVLCEAHTKGEDVKECEDDIINQKTSVWDYKTKVWDYSTSIYLHPGQSFRFKTPPFDQEEMWFDIECTSNGCIISPMTLPIIKE